MVWKICCCCGCCSCCPKWCNTSVPVINRTITLGCFGIDGAGKTTILKMLKGEDPRNVLTTNGFSVLEMIYNDQFRLRIFDIGGDKGIRDIWPNYYGEVYGIIYVIDYSNEETFRESIEAMQLVTQHPQCSRKPILFIVNNKNNLEIDDVEITNAANIQATSDSQQQMVMITHVNRYNGYLDNVKTSNMNVSQRAKKDRSAFQDQFVAFMSLIIEHYVYLSEGVRTAEIALKIKQQADKDKRRMVLMKEEHEQRKADIAALEGRRSIVEVNPGPSHPPNIIDDQTYVQNQSPPMSLASSTIPSDMIHKSPNDTPPPEPIKISQSSTKPVSPGSYNEVTSISKEKNDDYFIPPKSPGRHISRIQRIQNALSNRVVPSST